MIRRIFFIAFLFYVNQYSQTFTTRTELLQNIPFNFVNSLSACSIDYDNDGLIDIYLPSSTGLGLLFKNEGVSGFNNVMLQTGLNDDINNEHGSWGGVWGDYNNDGFLDVYFVNSLRLFQNNGDGTFTDKSHASNIQLLDNSFIQGMAWIDYNIDGKIDLFLGDDFGNNQLFHNEDYNSFQNIVNNSNINTIIGTYGVSSADINNDRYPDIFIAGCRPNRDSSESHLLLNNQDGTFTNIGKSAGVNDSLASWGVVWLDYDNDLDMDIYETNLEHNFANQPGFNKLYVNKGNLTFEDKSFEAGVRGDEDDKSFGVVSFDFNNDGWIDIYAPDFRNGDKLYVNNQDGTFSDNSSQAGFGADSSAVVTAADYNNDGWIDLFKYSTKSFLKLQINDGGENYWIKINTRGTASNHFGIGARIELYTDSLTQLREIKAGEGFISQSQNLTAHFGLGRFNIVERIVVKWPSGIDDVIENVIANQTITIREGTGIVTDINSKKEIPEQFLLEQNYPNPFNPSTTISFSLAQAGKYSVQIYNVLGQLVETLVDQEFTPGNYRTDFNASRLSSGVYIYKLTGVNVNISSKMLLVK